MRPIKKPKRTATAISDWDWRAHPESGLFYRYYVDEFGQQQIQWSEPETPRTGYVNEAGENELDSQANYILAANSGVGNPQQLVEEPRHLTEDSSEGYIVPDLSSLTVADDDDDDDEDPGAHQSTHGAGSSSKGKSKEGRSSKRDEKKPPSKSKKDSKSGGDKKPKGKGKERAGHDNHGAPADPFYTLEPPYQAQHPQQQSQPQPPRGHQKKRTKSHGASQQAAPTGLNVMAAETAYYAPDDQSDAGQDLDNPIESPDEIHEGADPSGAGYYGGYRDEDLDDEGDEMQRALEASRQATFTNPAGYVALPPGYDQGESSSSAAEFMTEPTLDDEDDDGTTTPTRANPGLGMDYHIRGTGGNFETIDARYCVEPSNRFQPGEVFKVLWSEPQGQKGLDIKNKYTEKYQVDNAWGERFYVGFRRFIIVANDEGHCTCVPILTYIRQGCKKRGVKPAKHGIVHAQGTRAQPLPGEPPLGFRPIRLQLYAAGEGIVRESRVNYSKLVTVEHNVKVFFIGSVVPRDFDDIVRGAVDACWTMKVRDRTRRGGPGPDPR